MLGFDKQMWGDIRRPLILKSLLLLVFVVLIALVAIMMCHRDGYLVGLEQTNRWDEGYLKILTKHTQ
jgi:hypothetical protein